MKSRPRRPITLPRSTARALCAVLRDVDHGVLTLANGQLHDRLADIPELPRYEVFAADGHWHKAAAHDPLHGGVKLAVGHFYSLNLRTHTLRPRVEHLSGEAGSIWPTG